MATDTHGCKQVPSSESKFLDKSEREEKHSNGMSLSGNPLEQTTKAIRDDVECNRHTKSGIGTNDKRREQVLGLNKTNKGDTEIKFTVAETQEKMRQGSMAWPGVEKVI